MVAPPIIHRLPAFADNYIWLLEYQPGTVAVVDPGDAEPVLQAIADKGLTVSHILNTHWHGDHVGGNLALKQATGCTILGPARERDKIPGLDHAIDGGDHFSLGDQRADILFVGAHTAGHIAWHFPEAGILFPGDTLFAMGCGRLFEGDAEDLFRALAQLKSLPPETIVYCAHEYTLENARFALTQEPQNAALIDRYTRVQNQRRKGESTVPFTIGEELETNPFLRAETVAEVKARRRAKDVF